MWVFTYSTDSIHHHNYKHNSRYSVWKIYMSTISSTTHLGQIKTDITRASRHYLLAKKPWPNLHLKQNFQIGRYSLFLCRWTLYFHSYGCLLSPFTWMKRPCVSKTIMRGGKDDVQIRRWWITDRLHIKYLYAMTLCQKHI